MKKTFSLVLALVILSSLVVLMSCQTKEVTSAKVYIQQNNWDKAIEQLEQAVVIYPNDAEAHYLLGDAYGNKSMWSKMNEMFNKSLAIAPTFEPLIKSTRDKYWVTVFNQGVAKVNVKNGEPDLDSASKDFNTAIEIDPKRPESYKNLAFTYLRRSNLDEAVKTYNQYLEVNTKDVAVMNEVARLYLEKKEYAKAQEICKKIQVIDPDNGDAVSNLAMAYDLDGQNDMALATYEKALAKNPNDQDLLFNLARLHYINKAYDKAIEMFQRVITQSPDDYDANLNIGNAYLTMADDLRKSLVEKEAKKETIADTEVAKLKEFYKAAIPFLEKAITIKPEIASVYYNLGVAYVNVGEPDKGKEFFDKAENMRN